MDIETIKIDGVQYDVPKIAAELFDKLKNDKEQLQKQVEIHENAYLKQGRRVSEYRYIIGKLITEGKVIVPGDIEMEALGEKMKVEWEYEVKNGMSGWIQTNWDKLCHLKCNCGNLVSYDVLRMTNELKCKSCGGKNVDLKSAALPVFDDSCSFHSEKEIREPIQNALYATGNFLTDECTELATGILEYLQDAGYKVVRQ